MDIEAYKKVWLVFEEPALNGHRKGFSPMRPVVAMPAPPTRRAAVFLGCVVACSPALSAYVDRAQVGRKWECAGKPTWSECSAKGRIGGGAHKDPDDAAMHSTVARCASSVRQGVR